MRIALVGPTGCGKTTLINLLMRFYDVNSEPFSVDGKPVDQISRHSLRSSYGMVLQDTWIKNGTVRENITIGKPDASEDERSSRQQKCLTAGNLSAVFLTVWIQLSQRTVSARDRNSFSITRVMLCLPPMLTLDEATSSIDTRTEMLIQEALTSAYAGTDKLYCSTQTVYYPKC